jgi:hypothetical protein
MLRAQHAVFFALDYCVIYERCVQMGTRRSKLRAMNRDSDYQGKPGSSCLLTGISSSDSAGIADRCSDARRRQFVFQAWIARTLER